MFLPYLLLQCLTKPAIAKYPGAYYPKFQTSGPLVIMTDSSRNCSLIRKPSGCDENATVFEKIFSFT